MNKISALCALASLVVCPFSLSCLAVQICRFLVSPWSMIVCSSPVGSSTRYVDSLLEGGTTSYSRVGRVSAPASRISFASLSPFAPVTTVEDMVTSRSTALLESMPRCLLKQRWRALKARPTSMRTLSTFSVPRALWTERSPRPWKDRKRHSAIMRGAHSPVRRDRSQGGVGQDRELWKGHCQERSNRIEKSEFCCSITSRLTNQTPIATG